jgi:hypothetical protein
MKKLYLLLVLSILTSAAAFAQDSLDVHFNGLGWLDNREYKAFIPRSRTYSGTRTELDFGLHIDTNNSFMVGTNAIHEFGAQPYFLNAVPIAYYHFESKSWLFNAGEFPREGLIDDFPRAILNDTLMYYRPNIEGLLTRYTSDNFWQIGFIDWLSRQTDTQREEFMFGAEGKFTPNPDGIFYVRDYFMMEHDAGAAILQPTDHIYDNGAFELRLGLDFTKRSGLDSLAFEAGNLTSFLRERGSTGWETRNGFMFTAYAAYHRFAFRDELYKGQGSIIYYGDSFYEKTFYNRLDVIFTPFKTRRVTGQFIASFHFSPDHYNDNQEVFRVTYDLGRKKVAKFR